MFYRKLFLTAAISAVLTNQSAANAQLFNRGCNSCSAASAPVMQAASCTPIQPVQTSCYQTVPVTTYQREQQKVRVPYYQTAMETQTVTVMEPVTRQVSREIPTVSYKTVVENRVVNRDMGRWQTNYTPVAKCDPCQVDPRPGMIGWLNRTGYSFRSAFVPNYRTSRQYVPNMVTCNVPTTRQVAVHGTQKVVENITEMVPRQKTVQVEVSKLAWREETQTVMKPTTAYRTVPIGSSLAYGYGGSSQVAYGYGGSSMAYGYGGYGYPATAYIVDESNTSRSALLPEEDPNFKDTDTTRSARNTFDKDLPDDPNARTFQRTESDKPGFQRSSFNRTLPPAANDSLKQSPNTFKSDEELSPFPPATQRDSRAYQNNYTQATLRPASRGWKSSSRSTSDNSSTASDDRIAIPGLSMTDRN
ncbi:MAG: hypothetical protein WAO83_26765 [Fuerstiella sp.]